MIPDLIALLAAAEEASGGPDVGKILGSFVQYGMVGVFALLLVLGVVVPKWAMTALTAEKDNRRTARPGPQVPSPACRRPVFLVGRPGHRHGAISPMAGTACGGQHE